MQKAEVARILGEELRTNVGLRRQLGMAEGDSSGVLSEEGAEVVHFTSSEGDTFILAVGDQADLDDA